MVARLAFTISILVLFSPCLSAQRAGSSAWEQLLRSNPTVVDDQSLEWRDRLILHVLTPEQADDYYSGRVGEDSLRLADGRTLAGYLEAKLSPRPGLLVALPVPCPLFRLGSAGGESLLRVRVDLSEQGGAADGCGVPENATALLLRVQADGDFEGSVLKLWPADGPEPGSPLLETRSGNPAETTAVVPLCAGDCGLVLRDDAGGRVKGEVLGYLQPQPAGSGPIAVPFGPREAFTESGSNNFFGTGAGASITTGTRNSFFGANAGNAESAGFDNSFFGFNAGALNTGGGFFPVGVGNSYFGSRAGETNSTGTSNSFFGAAGGRDNTTGSGNSYFGHEAGLLGTVGSQNAFFGTGAGRANTADFNSFFGNRAGASNLDGSRNSFVGHEAGLLNESGSFNTFVGVETGRANGSGSSNSFFGFKAGEFSTSGTAVTLIGALASEGGASLTNATALGHQALVLQDNSVVLGSIQGFNGAASSVRVGIGTFAPDEALHVHRQDGTVQLLVEETSGTTANRDLLVLRNNGAPQLWLTNSALGDSWVFAQSATGAFQFSRQGTGGPELLIQANGRVLMGPGPVTNFDLRPNGDLFIPNGMVMDASHSSLKKDFEPASGREVLEKVAQLELATWRYREGQRGRHLGPMAEEFHQLFGLGEDDRSIAALDGVGVSLAAIQGLYKLLHQTRAELATRDAEVDQLRAELAEIRSLLSRER